MQSAILVYEFYRISFLPQPVTSLSTSMVPVDKPQTRNPTNARTAFRPAMIRGFMHFHKQLKIWNLGIQHIEQLFPAYYRLIVSGAVTCPEGCTEPAAQLP